MTYYYDDDCKMDHHKSHDFSTKEKAIEWFELRVARFKPDNAILYIWEGEKPETIKEIQK